MIKINETSRKGIFLRLSKVVVMEPRIRRIISLTVYLYLQFGFE